MAITVSLILVLAAFLATVGLIWQPERINPWVALLLIEIVLLLQLLPK